jgi:hypothetical protein
MLARHEITGLLPYARTVGNLAIIWPGPQLPFRDNTLDAIPPGPQTQQGSPGPDYSRPPAIRTFRSSSAV